jgi:hypothetical protein
MRSCLAPLAALALLGASTAVRADEPGADGAAAPVATPAPAPAPAASRTAFDLDPGDPIEVRYPPSIVRLKLIAAGIVVTGLAWGVSFACAATWPYVPNPGPGAESGPPGSGQLKIPVLGPWIMLGHSGCAPDEPYCPLSKIGIRDTLLVVDGIVQLAGLALITEAIVMKTSPPVKKSTSLLGLRVGGIELTPTPIVTPTVTGLGVSGSF